MNMNMNMNMNMGVDLNVDTDGMLGNDLGPVANSAGTNDKTKGGPQGSGANADTGLDNDQDFPFSGWS